MKKVHDISLPDQMTKPDLAAIAVFLLGGDQKAVDTEDVAMKVNSLVPNVFVWKKYPDQINLKLIEAFLYDAKKERCGELLMGTSRQGWRLSPKGIDWLRNKGTKYLQGIDAGIDNNLAVAGTDPHRVEREKKRLLNSNAWQNWTHGQKLQNRDVLLLFRVDEYTNESMLDTKIARMKALFINDNETSTFLQEAENVIRMHRE